MPPKRDQLGKSKQPRQRKRRVAGIERRRAPSRAKNGALARGSTPATPASAPSSDEAEPHESGERLQKVLAAAGLASRRECEELIREGRVEVDRQVVTELGTRVDPQRQEIRVDGEALPTPKLVYFAVNKPEGVVSTSRDPAGRPRIIDLMPPGTPRVFAVGRLDMSSEGLILVTNDGELANVLTHPRHGVEKIYHVQVAGQVERDTIGKLQRGVHLAEGFARAKHVKIKSRQKKSTLLEMVLDEGRNREIRRLLAHMGHKVQRLRRIAVGPVRLADLPPGAVRPLTKQEVTVLKRDASHKRPGKTHDDDSQAGERVETKIKKPSHRDHRGHREANGKQTSMQQNRNAKRTKHVAPLRKTRKGNARKGAKAQS